MCAEPFAVVGLALFFGFVFGVSVFLRGDGVLCSARTISTALQPMTESKEV
jgi:hypothetical protein